MQTIYTTSSRLGVRMNNVIDLNEYRRDLGLTREERGEEIEISPLLWSTEGEETAPARSASRCARAAGASAWLLDIMASASVVAMTAVFTLQIL